MQTSTHPAQSIGSHIVTRPCSTTTTTNTVSNTVPLPTTAHKTSDSTTTTKLLVFTRPMPSAVQSPFKTTPTGKTTTTYSCTPPIIFTFDKLSSMFTSTSLAISPSFVRKFPISYPTRKPEFTYSMTTKSSFKTSPATKLTTTCKSTITKLVSWVHTKISTSDKTDHVSNTFTPKHVNQHASSTSATIPRTNHITIVSTSTPTLATNYLTLSKADVNVCQLPANRRTIVNVSCDFETAGCKARFTSPMSSFWEFKSGPVGNLYGRINGDHTRGNSGMYCLFDAANFFPKGDKNKDQLLPPPVPYSNFCLSFWYNLPARTSNIKVIAEDRVLFERVSNVTHGWVQEIIFIKGKAPLQVKFESTKTSLYGFVGIDDIVIEIENPARPSAYKSTLHTIRKLLTPSSPKSMRRWTTKSALTTTGKTPRTVTLAAKHTGLSTRNATTSANATSIIPTFMTKQVRQINASSKPTKSASSVNNIMITKTTSTIISRSIRNSNLATKHTYPAKITTLKSTSPDIAKHTLDILTKATLIKAESTISANSATHKTNILRPNALFTVMNMRTRNITRVTNRTTHITKTTTNNTRALITSPLAVTRKVSLINISPTTESKTLIATRDVNFSSISKPSGLMTKESTKNSAIKPTIVMAASKSRTTNVTRTTTVVLTSSFSQPLGRTTNQNARTSARTQLNSISTTKSRNAAVSRATTAFSFSSPFHPPGPTTKQISRILVTTQANIMLASESRRTNATKATQAVSSSFPSKPLSRTTNQNARTPEITQINIVPTTASKPTNPTSAIQAVSSSFPSQPLDRTTIQSAKTPAIAQINIKQTTESRTAVPTRSNRDSSFSSPSKPPGSTAKQSPSTPTVTRIHIIWETDPTNITFTSLPGVTTRTMLHTDRKISNNLRVISPTNTAITSLKISPAITLLETKSVIPTSTTSNMNIAALTPTTTISKTLSTSIPTKATGKYGDVLTNSLSVHSKQSKTPNAHSTSVTTNSTISPYKTISPTRTKCFSIIKNSRTTLQDMVMANLMSMSNANYKISSKTMIAPKTETHAHAEMNFFNAFQTNSVSSKKQNLVTTTSAQTAIITLENPSLSSVTLNKFIFQVPSTKSIKITSLKTKMDINIKKFPLEDSHAKFTMIIAISCSVTLIVLVVILFFLITRYKSRRMSVTFLPKDDSVILFDDNDNTSDSYLIQLQSMERCRDI
ncbi:hypothetical protein CHS0354_037936 [Potamilus streckersoni]|uniref:MAM domain-containing protein n=1 Tax=Potamilus streckersoni TaxID=2493646 RepID=A0AAE0TA74_9BIVA|nr:hypothetical protein CHS0354_037936 [Potamilus streckersoni]